MGGESKWSLSVPCAFVSAAMQWIEGKTPGVKSERIFVTYTVSHTDMHGHQKVKYHKIVLSVGSEGDNTVGNGFGIKIRLRNRFLVFVLRVLMNFVI